jgi:exosortase/archaeosortase family protein
MSAPKPQAPRFWTAKASFVSFGLKFGILMALYYGFVLLPFFDRLLYRYLCANAWVTNALLNFLGTPSQVSEITIHSAGHWMNVRRGCDALEPAWFFCAAVISFPGPWGQKISGILVGSAAILVLNLVRLASLYLIGLHYPGFFGPAHLEIWPAAFIVLAVFLFIGWTGWAARRANAGTHEGR